MTDQQIDRLISRRNKLTERRDGLYDHKRVDAIDAKLRAVPAGQRNDVDLLLGRACAKLPPREEYSPRTDGKRVVMAQHLDGAQEIDPAFTRWSTDEQRAEWQAGAAAEIAPLAEQKMIDYNAWRDQTADYDDFNGVDRAAELIEETPRDWLYMRGDCAI